IVLRNPYARVAEPDALAPERLEQYALKICAMHDDGDVVESACKGRLTGSDKHAAVPRAESGVARRHAEGSDLVREVDLAERANCVEQDRDAGANFAEGIGPLVDLDADACPIERDRGRQSRDAAADDEGRQRPSHVFNNGSASYSDGTTTVAASFAAS